MLQLVQPTKLRAVDHYIREFATFSDVQQGGSPLPLAQLERQRA